MPEGRDDIGAGASGVLVALAHGSVTLLIPGEAVRDLEHAMDIESESSLPATIGNLVKGGHQWPVYALDDNLQPNPNGLAGARVCALVDAAGSRFALVGDSVVMHRTRDLQLTPLPPAMALPGSPIAAITLLADRIALVLDAERLARDLMPDVSELTPEVS